MEGCVHIFQVIRQVVTGPKVKSISTLLRKLTFNDLHEWVGGTILNRGKGYIKQVDQISRTQDDTLVAWVNGSDRYITSVRIDGENDFEYFCSCPYSWGPCKHAVAVILAAAELAKQNQSIPILSDNDALSLALLVDGNEEEDEWENDQLVHSSEAQRSKSQNRVKTILADKSRAALLDQLLDLAGRYPEVRRQILEAEQLASGQVDKLVRALLAEIRNLTAEPVWYNHWRDEGNLPDYTHLGERLQALTDQGYGDAVLQLGVELWNRGNSQVEQSDDEGETAIAIAACMETVMAALPQSSLPPPEQLLWVIDRVLEDEYCMLDSAGMLLQRRSYTRDHWREVADTLETRLQGTPKPRIDSFSTRYRRERLLNQLLNAYGRAGWKNRIIPLLEAEADACHQYARLADALLENGERDRARHWCIHGYRQTVEDTPGIAAALQEQLRKMAQTGRQHDLVAAYRAQDFFARPSRTSYHELCKAAKKAKCWPAVRSSVFHYLETGQHPATSGRKDKSTGWPLPSPEVEPTAIRKRSGFQQFPDLTTLIDIAILEKRLDDVVELYHRLCTTKHWGLETDKTVAQAVADTHPQVALDIWQRVVDALIGQVKPKAYEEAAIYLRRMEKVYSRNQRIADWQELIGELRKKHKRKRRLISTLDNLSNKKIVDW